MNRMKAALFLTGLIALPLGTGQAPAGPGGFVTALLFTGVMSFGAYRWSDRIGLRMSGAQGVTEVQAPELHGSVRRLASRAGLPMPRLFGLPEGAPRAFTTGRDPRRTAGGVGILADLARWGLRYRSGGGRSSDDREEGGAHPSPGRVGVTVAPFAALLIQAVISRTGVLRADGAGARLVVLARQSPALGG